MDRRGTLGTASLSIDASIIEVQRKGRFSDQQRVYDRDWTNLISSKSGDIHLMI